MREKVKADRKGSEEHSLEKNKHKMLNGGQKRTLLGGAKERKARKAGQKEGFQKGRFRPYQPDKGEARITPRTKTKEKTQKEKARKEFIRNPDFQPLTHPAKKDMDMLGNRTSGLLAIGLMSPRLQLMGGLARKLILHGRRKPL